MAPKLYEKAYSSLPEKATIPADKLLKKATAMKDRLAALPPSDKDSLAIKKDLDVLIKNNINKGKNPTAEIQKLTDFKRKINKVIGYGKEGKQELKLVSRMLNEGIDEAEKLYPDFYKNYKLADEFWGATQGRSVIREVFKKYPKAAEIIDSPAIKALMGIAGVGGGALYTGLPKAAGITTAAAGGLALASEMSRAVMAMIKSPNIAKNYMQALKAGAAGQALVSAKYANKAIKEIKDVSRPKFVDLGFAG